MKEQPRLYRDFFVSLSVILFFASLALPVERFEPGDPSPQLFGELRGAHLFLYSFLGLANTEALQTDTGMYLFIVSGTICNVLLFAGWLGAFANARRALRLWMAAAGVVLAFASFTQMPWHELAAGYWTWLGSQVSLLVRSVREGRAGSRIGAVAVKQRLSVRVKPVPESVSPPPPGL